MSMSGLLQKTKNADKDRSPVPFSRPSSPKPGSTGPQIGFVGLGNMGSIMARNLATHRESHPPGSPPILIWNRTRTKAEELANQLGPQNIKIAENPGQIAAECDIIITNLANDKVVRAIYVQFADALKDRPATKNKIFVETSTIYPSLAGELDGLISSNIHCHLITSPVFGNPTVAAESKLLIVMSGEYRSKKEAAYLLVPAVGRKVIDLGGNLEKASTFKLIGNSIILGSLEILAESFTLADKSGIGADNVLNLVKELLPAPIIVAYGEKMANDRFDGTHGFSLEGGIKDASYIRRLTAHHNSPMPVIDVAQQHLVTARALHSQAIREGKQNINGNGVFDVLDWSGIIAGTRTAAGLDPFDSAKHSSLVREDANTKYF